MKKFINIIKNPFIQIIIIIIIIILIFAILLKFKKNNVEYFEDIPITPGTENINQSDYKPPVIANSSVTGIKPDKINNKKNTYIFSLPDRVIYKLLNDINMRDIVVKYFELKYNEFKNNSDNIQDLSINCNDKNMEIQEFIDNYLTIITTIDIPEYNDFLKEVFESDQINGILLLNNFNTLKTLYCSLVNVSYLFQTKYYERIINIEKNYYSIIFKKFNINYDDIGDFSYKLYTYLLNNFGDTDKFNNAVKSSFNFINNIYNNKSIGGIASLNYHTKKEVAKKNLSEIYFNLLNYSTNDILNNYINTLMQPDYVDKIDNFNDMFQS